MYTAAGMSCVNVDWLLAVGNIRDRQGGIQCTHEYSVRIFSPTQKFAFRTSCQYTG